MNKSAYAVIFFVMAVLMFGLGVNVGYDAHKPKLDSQQIVFSCGNSHISYQGAGKYRVTTEIYLGDSRAVKF